MTDSSSPRTLDSQAWPIAVCMHGFSPVDREGTALHDAAPEVWDRLFAEVARATDRTYLQSLLPQPAGD